VPPECVIFVGLPGSGKTTFYQQYFAATHRQLSNDLLPRTRRGITRLLPQLEAALRAGQPAVVDNTNPSAADRAPFIALARSLGVPVRAVFFDTTARACVARNARRAGAAKDPNVAIFAAATRIQRPAWAEGFDRILTVSPLANGGFSISEEQRKPEVEND